MAYRFFLILILGMMTSMTHPYIRIHDSRIDLHLPKKVIHVDPHNRKLQVERDHYGLIKRLHIPYLSGELLVVMYPNPNRHEPFMRSIIQYSYEGSQILRSGVSYTLHTNGTTESVTRWLDGDLDGKQEYYNKDGDLIATKEYEQGIPIGVWQQYYPSGQLATEVTYPSSRFAWDQAHSGIAQVTTKSYRFNGSVIQQTQKSYQINEEGMCVPVTVAEYFFQ